MFLALAGIAMLPLSAYAGVLSLSTLGAATTDASSQAVTVVTGATAATTSTATVPSPAPTTTPVADTSLSSLLSPIVSNFSRLAFLGPGYLNNGSRIPVTAKPDVVGAFRLLCAPGQMAYDDPIIYPGVKGGSPHLHQFYGNLTTSGMSTYASLRGAGDSSCGNPLNRSAYWIPALFTGAGQVIRPDFIAIYYKRYPDGDPTCLKQATQGCADMPAGLRVVAGYDMKRMNEAQPENVSTYTHRCISAGKPSIHRKTLAEAVADCGGAGQIMSAITFGSCWDGRLDSPDHRAHLAYPSYGSWGYLKCPAGKTKVLPTLTQQIAYTVKAEDGDIYFASDRMMGMKMAGGSSFHADYMEAWDPATRETWHRNCLGKLLSCVDGELGDGTKLTRGNLPTLATPRVVAAPKA